MLNETERKVLLRAAELISNREAWIKGDLFGWKNNEQQLPVPNTDRYCALGAIRKATVEVCGLPEGVDLYNSLPGDAHEVEKMVQGVVEKHLPRAVDEDGYDEGEDSIPAFNDASATTHEQVKQLFCNAVREEFSPEVEFDAENKGDDTKREEVEDGSD